MGIVALIPARSQSKRIPNKNVYHLNGHPLLAYSIQSAKDSNLFDKIIVSSDSKKIGEIAVKYGAEFIECPLSIAHKDADPDIKWVRYTLEKLLKTYEYFSILRPTSPFRTGETIKRAWNEFKDSDADSIRAVELCSQSPYKMWLVEGKTMKSLMDSNMHSMPSQFLPQVYVQNASLEIAHTYCVTVMNSIAGKKVMPFFTEGYEGFDINEKIDLDVAHLLISRGDVTLSEVKYAV